MTERPILFSGAMARAILAGTKTQTRRLVKIEDGKVRVIGRRSWLYLDFDGVPGLSWRPYGGAPTQPYPMPERACPYGAPGDRLWVRESWWPYHEYGKGGAVYRADSPGLEELGGKRVAWRPSIHMPRWASRITLEVTGVGVQRLQEITEEDAAAEGVSMEFFDELREAESAARLARLSGHPQPGPRAWAFSKLWDSINAKRAPWASIPWVWLVSFKRVS